MLWHVQEHLLMCSLRLLLWMCSLPTHTHTHTYRENMLWHWLSRIFLLRLLLLMCSLTTHTHTYRENKLWHWLSRIFLLPEHDEMGFSASFHVVPIKYLTHTHTHTHTHRCMWCRFPWDGFCCVVPCTNVINYICVVPCTNFINYICVVPYTNVIYYIFHVYIYICTCMYVCM